MSYPISLSRGAYWLGRSYEKIGDKAQSKKWYEEATKIFINILWSTGIFKELNPMKQFELDEQASCA